MYGWSTQDEYGVEEEINSAKILKYSESSNTKENY